jgi:hypothetical protein
MAMTEMGYHFQRHNHRNHRYIHMSTRGFILCMCKMFIFDSDRSF